MDFVLEGEAEIIFLVCHGWKIKEGRFSKTFVLCSVSIANQIYAVLPDIPFVKTVQWRPSNDQT